MADWEAITRLTEERAALRAGIKKALTAHFTGAGEEAMAQALIDAKHAADGMYGGVVVPIKACHYCGVRQSSVISLTRDHVVPRSRGGSSEGWNVVWACEPCNGAKGSTWPTCACETCAFAVEQHAARFGLVRENAGFGHRAVRR